MVPLRAQTRVKVVIESWAQRAGAQVHRTWFKFNPQYFLPPPSALLGIVLVASAQVSVVVF